MAADAIARNYDAVEDGSELFLIAVRRSGSFAKRDALQSLSAHSFGNLIYAWGSLFSPSIPISKVYPGQPSRLAGVRGDFQRNGSAYVQISAASRKSNRVRRTRQGFDQRWGKP
jgi:hypothetical protein